MSAQSSAFAQIAFTRSRGGFRRLIQTELGEEQVCMSCGEAWPTDPEFFVVTSTSLAYECKACTSERKARPGAGSGRAKVDSK